jgi:hypothetical protein
VRLVRVSEKSKGRQQGCGARGGVPFVHVGRAGLGARNVALCARTVELEADPGVRAVVLGGANLAWSCTLLLRAAGAQVAWRVLRLVSCASRNRRRCVVSTPCHGLGCHPCHGLWNFVPWPEPCSMPCCTCISPERSSGQRGWASMAE